MVGIRSRVDAGGILRSLRSGWCRILGLIGSYNYSSFGFIAATSCHRMILALKVKPTARHRLYSEYYLHTLLTT